MAKMVWDAIGNRQYETGTSKGALFVKDASGAYGTGVPWNGLVSVKQSPDGAEPNDIYADNMKYLSMMSAENFKGSIDAYTYPEEFEVCDGSAELVTGSGVYVGQQSRRGFGLVYSTVVGNDTMGNAYGEKLHIIYNATVAPSERAYETINDTPAAITFSWNFTTVPESVDDIPEIERPTAYVSLDSTKVSSAAFAAIKDLVYGTEALEPEMPTLSELISILQTTTTTTV